MKNPKPDTAARYRHQARTRSKPGGFSTCYRHPDEPVNGICAPCLRERLSRLDVCGDPRTTISVTLPELRRCRSVSAPCRYDDAGSDQLPRRRSCDVRDRNKLSDLFEVDDGKNAVAGSGIAESKKLGFCKVNDEVTETIDEDRIHEQEDSRVLDIVLPQNVAAAGDVFDDDDEGGEIKTMKEFIDLEIRSKNEKPKDLRNLWDAASVFSRKLRKWKQKEKNKELREGNIVGGDINDFKYQECRPQNVAKAQCDEVHYTLGRRSCDTDSRLRVDIGRISIDEPRASWDGGYLIDRNTPKHGGTVSGGHRMSVDGLMELIVEDESSSGGSGPSNSDDSSSSQRPSSFDWSSSVRSFSKKAVGLESDEANTLVNNVRMSPHKLVITEMELKNWRLKSIKDDDNFDKFEPVSEIATTCLEAASGSLNGLNKSTRWRKMCSILGFRPKPKFSEKNCASSIGNAVESGRDVIDASSYTQTQTCGGNVSSSRKSFDMVGLNQSVRNGGGSVASSRKSFDMLKINLNARSGEASKEGSGWKLTHSGSVASSRRSFDGAGGLNQSNDGGKDFILELNKSKSNRKSCVSKFDNDDAVPFYLAPLRSSKSVRHIPEN